MTGIKNCDSCVFIDRSLMETPCVLCTKNKYKMIKKDCWRKRFD